MFNVRLAGNRLCGRRLFAWLSLMVSLVASFVLSFFPLDVLDEIWDLIESVSERFFTYSWRFKMTGAYTKCAFAGVVIILIFMLKYTTYEILLGA